MCTLLLFKLLLLFVSSSSFAVLSSTCTYTWVFCHFSPSSRSSFLFSFPPCAIESYGLLLFACINYFSALGKRTQTKNIALSFIFWGEHKIFFHCKTTSCGSLVFWKLMWRGTKKKKTTKVRRKSGSNKID